MDEIITFGTFSQVIEHLTCLGYRKILLAPVAHFPNVYMVRSVDWLGRLRDVAIYNANTMSLLAFY